MSADTTPHWSDLQHVIEAAASGYCTCPCAIERTPCGDCQADAHSTLRRAVEAEPVVPAAALDDLRQRIADEVEAWADLDQHTSALTYGVSNADFRAVAARIREGGNR